MMRLRGGAARAAVAGHLSPGAQQSAQAGAHGAGHHALRDSAAQPPHARGIGHGHEHLAGGFHPANAGAKDDRRVPVRRVRVDGEARIFPTIQARDAAQHAVAIHAELRRRVEVAVTQIVEIFWHARHLAAKAEFGEFGTKANSRASVAKRTFKRGDAVRVGCQYAHAGNHYALRIVWGHRIFLLLLR